MTIDELVLGVRIALLAVDVGACEAFDHVAGLDAGAQLCRLVILPDHDLEVVVDSANEVLERDESNNRQDYSLAYPYRAAVVHANTDGVTNAVRQETVQRKPCNGPGRS